MSLKISFFFLLIPLFVTAQELEFENPYSDFSVDHLGNLYTIFEQNTLTKMVETTEFEIEQYEYSNRSLGGIANFDVTNPLKIIVNHQDFSTLVLLDVTLRETAKIYLPDLEIYSSPVAYSLANDLTVWLYDDANQQLVRVNERGEELFRSPNLIQTVDFAPTINRLASSKNYLVAHDKARGFLVFDLFGAFIKLIPIKNIDHFQLVDSTLFYAKDNVVFGYPIKISIEKKKADLPANTGKFILQGKKLYFLNELGVGEMSVE